MGFPFTWVHGHTADVQAIAAVVVVLLTAALVWATIQYTTATRGQLAELRETRLASVRPYLHATHSRMDAAEAAPHDLHIHVELFNAGSGPALDIRAQATNLVIVFKPTLVPVLVANRPELFEVVSSSDDTPKGISEDVSPRKVIQFEARYRDLADRQWLTKLDVQIDVRRESSGWVCTNPRVVPESERVTEVSSTTTK
jgi:hypothetical protein